MMSFDVHKWRRDHLLTEDSNTSSTEFEPTKLKFKFNEYKPFDAETMKMHYNKHYTGYTENLNKAIKDENIPVIFDEDMGGIRRILNSVSQYSDTIRDNGGGYFNHTLFFNGLNPEHKGKIEEGRLQELIIEQFKSMDKFQAAFKEAALAHFGSGWCWLMFDKGQFYITTTANQDNPYMDVVYAPGDVIIALDLWEHSYYLKYKNDRGKYIDDFFKLVCYEVASNRLHRAEQRLTY